MQATLVEPLDPAPAVPLSPRPEPLEPPPAAPALGGDTELPPRSMLTVRGTDGQGLRVRAAPSIRAAAHAVLGEGTLVEVADGPIAADGHRWYHVRSDGQQELGWVAGEYLFSTLGGQE